MGMTDFGIDTQSMEDLNEELLRYASKSDYVDLDYLKDIIYSI